jgi:hypothetical protein
MGDVKRWRVDIYIDEDRNDRRTYAQALLDAGWEQPLSGYGTAWRNPVDREMPEIGDELAASRALIDLAEELVHAATITRRSRAKTRRLISNHADVP